jgi:3-isopropylmalate/(R)-2-methylmalate dehydratase small subunit
MAEAGRITTYNGKAIVVRGNDIDTDRIIPARYMKCVTFEGLGQFAFYDERFTEDGVSKGHVFDDETYSGNPILLVNKNFGCGSSREHAPQALRDYGIRVVIGESFAEIFAGNCTAMGIPTVCVGEKDIEEIMDSVEAVPATELTVDLNRLTVDVGGKRFGCTMAEAYRSALLGGTWDSTSTLLGGLDDIQNLAKKLPYLNGYA